MWTPPLRFERHDVLGKDKNPYFQHAEAAYFIARMDGRPVGRISAQVDALAQVHQGPGTGHFGFLDAVDDPLVFDALFEAAETWLRERGMTRVLGPFSLSINEESGLLVEGFDEVLALAAPAEGSVPRQRSKSAASRSGAKKKPVRTG